MSKWYGNLDNRLEEGQNFTGRELQVGDDITMYMWSDRHCYYITEVENEKRIKVKPYFVCADKSKPGGMGHQDWVYFKDPAEYARYIKCENRQFGAREGIWVYRYGKWVEEVRYTENPHSEREKKSLENKGYFCRYFALPGQVSFGIRDYYYDWEF